MRSSEQQYSAILSDLRGKLAAFKPGNKTYDEIVATRDQVFARYQPVFSSEHVPQLSREEFTSFLYFENNHHWSGLYRKGLGAATDMPALRRALAVLLDERKPIRDRFPEALEMVSGLGKATATGILTVAYPQKYGVWNNTSEAAMRQHGIWPSAERGEGSGGRYERINDLMLRLAKDLATDLWTLDALWWFLLEPTRLEPAEVQAVEAIEGAERFGLESQLENFLLENWDRTPLGKEWSIFSTPDEPDAGNQFPTDVGRIDILAVHKNQKRLLVVELKRNQSTDQTVGQALRYVGWVKKHVATPEQTVEALIIAHTAGKELRYALESLNNVKALTYEIEFRLREPTWQSE